MVGCVGQSVTLTHIIADTDSAVSVTKVPTVVEQCNSCCHYSDRQPAFNDSPVHYCDSGLGMVRSSLTTICSSKELVNLCIRFSNLVDILRSINSTTFLDVRTRWCGLHQ